MLFSGDLSTLYWGVGQNNWGTISDTNMGDFGVRYNCRLLQGNFPPGKNENSAAGRATELTAGTVLEQWRLGVPLRGPACRSRV
jgi:hypothetical protein